jgi:hypothetical protein
MRNRSANGVESSPSRAHSTAELTRFTPKTSWVDVGALRKQIRQIAKSVKQFGFLNSILVDETRMVLAGHGRLEPPWKNLLVDCPNSRSSDWSFP